MGSVSMEDGQRDGTSGYEPLNQVLPAIISDAHSNEREVEREKDVLGEDKSLKKTRKKSRAEKEKEGELAKKEGEKGVEKTKESSQASAPKAFPVEKSVARTAKASVTPTEHSYHRFLGKRVQEALAKHNGVIKLVLIGDSILSHIQRDAIFWGQFDYQYNAMNLGSPGDRTEHVLSRLQSDYIDSIKNANLVVVMIGTNNIAVGDSTEAVVSGVAEVVMNAQKRFSKGTQIILLSILPRLSHAYNKVVVDVNSRLAEKFSSTRIKFLDLTENFADAKGKL